MGQNLCCSVIILLLLDIILFTMSLTLIKRKARPDERILETIFTSQKLRFLETMTQTRVYNSKLVLWNRSILSLCVDRMDVLCLLLYLERLRRTFMIRWWKSDRNSSCNVLQWSSVRRSAHLSCISVRLCHQMSVFTRIVTKILVSVWTRPEAALHIKIKVMWRLSGFHLEQEIFFCGWLKTHLIRADTHLQRLEDGSAVGGQLGVGGLAEELGEGSDGVQFVCWNLERKKKTKNVASNKHLRPQPPLPRSVFSSLLTSENFPSPNHCSHLMPWLACRLPVARHVTTMPGHQEKPLIFPHTSSPMPKPLLSWKSGGRESEDEVNPSLPTK